MQTETLILTDIPQHVAIKLARTAKGWNMWETAYHATQWLKENDRFHKVKVQPSNVSQLEHGGPLQPWRKKAIFAVLGMEYED